MRFKLNKKIIPLFVASMFVCSLVGCGNQSTDISTIDNSSETKVVRIAGATSQGTTLVLPEVMSIAQQEGFIEEEFEKIGYEVEYVSFQNGPAINEAIASGSVDFGCLGDFPAIIGISNELPMKIIGITNSATNMCILVRADDETIQSPNDLRGKTVNIAVGTVFQKLFYEVIDDYGIDISEINVVNSTAGQEALVTGSIDVLIWPDINAQTLISQGLAKSVYNTADGHEDRSYQAVLIGRTSFLDDNPNTGTAILTALVRAYQLANDNNDAAFEALTAGGQYTIDQVTSSYANGDGIFDFFSGEISDTTKSRLRVTTDFLLEQQLITNDVDVDDLVDTLYYEQAIQASN